MASSFEILAAIDLRGGRVVRLEQGDFGRETAFSDDPAAVARGFVADGARWLHVVDLDGARTGAPVHGDAIRSIIEAVGERAGVEVAGGLRDETVVAEALGAGAARIVLGTAGLRDPALVARLVDRHGPARIAVAIDVRDGLAVGDGWMPDAAGTEPGVAMGLLSDSGVTIFEVTAVARDGLGSGPDLELYERLVRLGIGSVIASAGIASIADVAAVRGVGCVGAIIGRALYDGRILLADAITASA